MLIASKVRRTLLLYLDLTVRVGNEADIVIVSVVRTERPGFLDNWNRMNVMLTRCKRGMVIVANRDFIFNQGKNTLLGRLAQSWGSSEKDQGWFDWRLIAERKAKLPSESLYRELESATPKVWISLSTIIRRLEPLLATPPSGSIPSRLEISYLVSAITEKEWATI